jgi:dienelactone hydrolase
MRRVGWLLVAALGGAASAAHAGARPAWASSARSATIPVEEDDGHAERMAVTWFVPAGPGPFPVVVFSHGRDPSAAGRASLALGVSRAQVLYWLSRGVAVVSPLRPGYGRSSGGDVESAGVSFDRTGRCVGHPDFRKTADVAARSVEATLQWLRSRSWADASAVLLAGQSAGGLATVAAAARGPAGVVGYVNFAGGTGGNPERAPGASCDPGQVEALYADYGRTTTVPNLWVYALNDQYWGPVVPRAWHAAFARGGSPTTFVEEPPVPDGDGHGLSRHAPALWAPAVDGLLARLGFPWNAATTPRPVLRLDPDGP